MEEETEEKEVKYKGEDGITPLYFRNREAQMLIRK